MAVIRRQVQCHFYSRILLALHHFKHLPPPPYRWSNKNLDSSASSNPRDVHLAWRPRRVYVCSMYYAFSHTSVVQVYRFVFYQRESRPPPLNFASPLLALYTPVPIHIYVTTSSPGLARITCSAWALRVPAGYLRNNGLHRA